MLSSVPFVRPLIHGHRGCRGLRPENTIPAFLHAVALGADVLELDVIISADRQVVVSHEAWPSALYCSAPDGAPVQPSQELDYNFFRLPYASIKEFDCGLCPHPDFPEQRLQAAHKPLLSAVVKAADQLAQQLGRPLPKYSVELKSTRDGDHLLHPEPQVFVELVLAVLGAAHVLPRTTLLCFDTRLLQVTRRTCPGLRLCLLVEESFRIAGIFDALGFIPEVVGPDFSLLTMPQVLQFYEAYPGVELVPWTINATADLQQVLRWPLAGITTDYPDRALALRH